jgi:hypothetical protein
MRGGTPLFTLDPKPLTQVKARILRRFPARYLAILK